MQTSRPETNGEQATALKLPLTSIEVGTADQNETAKPQNETAGPIGETKPDVGETLKSEPEPEVQSTPAAEIVDSAQASEKAYWMTTKSGVRHNARCRYYGKSNGMPCGPSDGRECKICGG